MAYIINPIVFIERISVKFTENFNYKTEFFGLDLYFGSWAATTEYKKVNEGTNEIQFTYDSGLKFEPCGLDDGISNKLPVREINMDVDLKTKSNILVSRFQANFFTLEYRKQTPRLIKIWNSECLEIATVVITALLDGVNSNYFDTDLPRFDKRAVLDDYGGVGKSNTYRLSFESNPFLSWDTEFCLERGKVSIGADGTIVGAAPGPVSRVIQSWPNCQEEIVSAVVAGVVVDNGISNSEKKSRTSRKTYESESVSADKVEHTLKLTIEACYGKQSELVIMHNNTVIFSQCQASPLHSSAHLHHKIGDHMHHRRFHTYKFEVLGIRQGTQIEVVLVTTVFRKKNTNTNSALEKMKMSLRANKDDVPSQATSSSGDYKESFISSNRYEIYPAAEVRYFSAEIIKNVISAKKALVSKQTSKIIRMPAALNPIPLRTASRPGSAPGARPGSPTSLAASFNQPLMASLANTGTASNPGIHTTNGDPNSSSDVICRHWKAKPATETGAGAWNERQLRAFRLFHRRSAIFIRGEYGIECCFEYMKRVQAGSCSDCRQRCSWYQKFIRATNEDNDMDRDNHNDEEGEEEEAEADPKKIDETIVSLLRYRSLNQTEAGAKFAGTIDDDANNNGESIQFPEYCLKRSCSGPYLYTYHSQKYLEELTYGIVGEGAGWLLRKSRKGFDWARWKERDRGYARKAEVIEFEHKRDVYEKTCMSKWICRVCGGTMPYNEDDEIRRNLARLKRLSVMFGDLENYSSDEEQDAGINYTTMKVSSNEWCMKCKQKYRPKVTWDPVKWEQKMLSYEARRQHRLQSLQQQIDAETALKYKKSVPIISSWWKGLCRKKNNALRTNRLAEAKLLTFAFGGSPFKFKDEVNLGGSLWERLVNMKTMQDAYFANKIKQYQPKADASGIAGTIVKDAPANKSDPTSEMKYPVEYDGIGEGCCINKLQAKSVSVSIDWNVAKSSVGLKFTLNEQGLGLSEVQQLRDGDAATVNQSVPISEAPGTLFVGPSRAVVHLISAGDEMISPRISLPPVDISNNNSIIFTDSISKAPSLCDDYSAMINKEGSYGEDSMANAFTHAAGTESILNIFEVIMEIPLGNFSTQRGNFSVGMSFNSLGGSDSGDVLHCPQFGKDMFSWGICEELVQSTLSSTKDVQEHPLPDIIPESICFAVYERGRRLYSIANIVPGDRIRLLLDPSTGRLSISILKSATTVEAVTSKPDAIVRPYATAGKSMRLSPIPMTLPKPTAVAADEANKVNIPPDMFEPSMLGIHHTFRVPSGPRHNYEIGCTLNANQKIVLLSSASDTSQSMPIPDVINDFDLPRTSRRPALAALLAPIAPIPIPVEDPPLPSMTVTARRKSLSPTATRSSFVQSPIAPRLDRSMTIVSLSQKLPALRKPSTSAVTVDEKDKTNTATTAAAAKVDITDPSVDIDMNADTELEPIRYPSTGKSAKHHREIKDSSGKLSSRNRSKFAARRRNAMHALDVHEYGYPALIDKEDSEVPWMLGVPGVIPSDALQQAGFVGLQYELPPEEDDEPVGIFSKDDERELFVVRVKYIAPPKYVPVAHGDHMKNANVKPDSRWALGCCVRGQGKQAQTIWIEKTMGQINYVSLLMTNTNVSSGRIQYLVDSKISLYRWRRGVTQYLDPNTGTMSTRRRNPAHEEYFEIPVSAVKAVHEILGDWEVIQYAVRAEIDNCVWVGVYYRHVSHDDVGMIGVKRLHQAQLATKLPSATSTSATNAFGRQASSSPSQSNDKTSAATTAGAPPVPTPTAHSTIKQAHPMSHLASSACVDEYGILTEDFAVSVLPDYLQMESITSEDRETAEIFARARNFVLVEERRHAGNEYALFPFMGTIREVHVSNVEFLCLA